MAVVNVRSAVLKGLCILGILIAVSLWFARISEEQTVGELKSIIKVRKHEAIQIIATDKQVTDDFDPAAHGAKSFLHHDALASKIGAYRLFLQKFNSLLLKFQHEQNFAEEISVLRAGKYPSAAIVGSINAIEQDHNLLWTEKIERLQQNQQVLANDGILSKLFRITKIKHDEKAILAAKDRLWANLLRLSNYLYSAEFQEMFFAD